MEPFLASSAHSTYATAFSFPLCYTTSDANSDSEVSTCSDTFRTVEAASALPKAEGDTFGNSACKDGLHTPLSRCNITPSLLPPLAFGNFVCAERPDGSSSSVALSTAETMHKFQDTVATGGKAHMVAVSTRALTAPSSRTLFAQSGSTSVISSFSSESIPVLLTSSQSQDSTDREGSPLYSDITDFGRQSQDGRSPGGSNLPSTHSFPRSSLEETCHSIDDTKSVRKHENLSDLMEDNLVNNSELTMSLESVLTVVPLSQARVATITAEPGGTGTLCSLSPHQCTNEPRHSTSSYGDTSLQSWDSHLEVDPVIDDIVESVIQDLKLHDVDSKPWNSVLHLDNSGTSERKASSASMSSYASSKRLEWDNGADIGYTEVPRKTGYVGPAGSMRALTVDVASSGPKLESMGDNRHISSHTVEKCTSPWFVLKHLENGLGSVKAKSPLSCDVTVQTDVSSTKDAEVQVQNVNTQAVQWVQSKSHAVCTEPSSQTASISRSSDGTSNSTTLHQCASITDSWSGISGRRASKLCINGRGTSSEKLDFTKDGIPDINQHKPKYEGGVLLKDCARSVALCYSQKFSREFESYISGERSRTGLLNIEGGNTARCLSSIGSQDNGSRVSADVSASGRKDGHFIPLRRLESMSSSRLKMQLPVTLAGLTSGTDSPAEAPRSCSEMNKRRLGYWLTCGFPYVPSVTPLKPETLPGLTDTGHGTKTVQGSPVKGEVFPPLSQEVFPQPWAETCRAHLPGALSPSNTTIRKRYVTRCQPSHITGPELPLHISESSRNVAAVNSSTAEEEIDRTYKLSIPLLREQGLQPVPSRTVTKSQSKVIAPNVKQEKAYRSTVKLRKGRMNHLPPSGASNDSEVTESSREWSSCEKRLESFTNRNSAGAKVDSFETFSDTSSCVSSHTSGDSRCRLKQVARKELEKLRMLVDRQKHSYLKRLQKEVNRLQKLEALFVNERDRQVVIPPHTAPAARSSRSCAITSSSRPPRTHPRRNHVMVQTSTSLDTCVPQRDRYFVSVTSSSPKKPRRQRGGRMPGVSWVVPLLPSAGSQKGSTPAEIADRLYQLKNFSLQAAFAEKCKHVIRHSQDRLSRVALLAKRRSKRQAIFPAVSHELKPVTHRRTHSSRSEGAPQSKTVFTHREMRQQTEKVYQKLPEIIEHKEKLTREQQYRINRLAVQIYSKAIQRHALKGHVSFAINRPCLDP